MTGDHLSCLGDVQLGHFMISEPYIFHSAAERQVEADCICCVCSQPVRLSVEQKQPPVQSHGPTSSRGTQSDGDVPTYGTQNPMEGASNFRGERQLSDTPARLHSLESQSNMKSDLPRRELSENGHRGPYAFSHFGHFGTGASTDAKHAKPEWKSGTLTLEPEPFTAAWLQSWENFAPGGVGRPLRPLPGHPVHSCHFWSNP